MLFALYNARPESAQSFLLQVVEEIIGKAQYWKTQFLLLWEPMDAAGGNLVHYILLSVWKR